MESTLGKLVGVLNVKARLGDKNTGEVAITYDAVHVSVEDFKRAIPTASGEKHRFVVLSAVEET